MALELDPDDVASPHLPRVLQVTRHSYYDENSHALGEGQSLESRTEAAVGRQPDQQSYESAQGAAMQIVVACSFRLTDFLWSWTEISMVVSPLDTISSVKEALSRALLRADIEVPGRVCLLYAGQQLEDFSPEYTFEGVSHPRSPRTLEYYKIQNELPPSCRILFALHDVGTVNLDMQREVSALLGDTRLGSGGRGLQAWCLEAEHCRSGTLDYQSEDGWTALMYAVALDTVKMHIARLFVLLGADVNLENKDGSTALLMASNTGNIELAQLLLEHKANVNHQEKQNGTTALLYASYEGHAELARLLVKHDANVGLCQTAKYTPLIRASEFGYIEIVKCILDSDDRQTDSCLVDHQDERGFTALHCASYNGNADIARLLLARTKDVNKEDEGGCTALIWASEQGHLDIVQQLLGRKANLDHTAHDRETALIRSGNNRQTETVLRLLECEATPSPAAVDALIEAEPYTATAAAGAECAVTYSRATARISWGVETRVLPRPHAATAAAGAECTVTYFRPSEGRGQTAEENCGSAQTAPPHMPRHLIDHV
jgi:ankyrin repeat protein